MTDPWLEFLNWEQASRDTIDFKTIYVDMADDLVSGLLLSQIVYWYLPSKKGGSKLRVFKDGYYWIAKARHEWWDEIRIKTRQIDRAITILEEKGIIISHLYRFNNAPTTHIRIIKEGFLTAWDNALTRFDEMVKSETPSDPFSPNLQFDLTDSSSGFDETVKSDLPESVQSLTETIIDSSETTAENTGDFSSENPNPDLFDLALKTEQAREQNANYAVPPSAGGDDVLVDTAIACLWSKGPKKSSGTYRDMVDVLSQVHADWGLHDMEMDEALDVIRDAVALFLQEKPSMVVYKYPSFAANYGHYLGRAQNDETTQRGPPTLTPAQEAILISRQRDEERRNAPY